MSKSLPSGRILLLVNQNIGLDRQLADSLFRMNGIRVALVEDAHGLVIHSAPSQGFGFKKLKLNRSWGIGEPVYFKSLRSQLLAVGQSALLKESPGVFIHSLGANGIIVFERNQ